MNVYVAMLRGINVGGRNRMRMEELHALLQSLQCREVRTYVQSGNIVFASSTSRAETIATRIEKEIMSRHGLSVAAIVRTPGQLQDVIDNNLFAGESGLDPKGLHVTFLQQAPEEGLVDKLGEQQAGGDRFVLRGCEVYLHCPGGYGRTRYNNTYFEQHFRVSATTRNWNTVCHLGAMARGET
jgi:uncharacterized protein (DUF1697 family)